MPNQMQMDIEECALNQKKSRLPFLIQLIDSFRSFERRKLDFGVESTAFNRRHYENPIQSLQLLDQQNLGLTNNVLVQSQGHQTNFFVPVYVTCKIKNIQKIEVQQLLGSLNLVINLSVYYGDLPQIFIKQMTEAMVVQLNRGQAIQLIDDGKQIKLKNNSKKKMLTYTIRKLFNAQVEDDTFLSPFEILNLIVSFTVSSLMIEKNKYPQSPGYDPSISYKISFNCMRSPDLIPITYLMDCSYGVYDLAEKLLETYYSNVPVYWEIKKKFFSYYKSKQNKNYYQMEEIHMLEGEKVIMNPPKHRRDKPLQIVHSKQQNYVKEDKDVEYFQYAHFIVPVYKQPENALLTIFIPILLLAVLSTTIFFQDYDLASRIGSIATLVLGFIALIPSIKDQLPPSTKLTLVEIVVYIQTLCCFLCLADSILGHNRKRGYRNLLLSISLTIHFICYLIVFGLYLFYRWRWLPNYNLDGMIKQIRPVEDRLAWNNPYCDDVFLKYNSMGKSKNLIIPYLSSK